ncbi:MAG: glycyl-radical enzyme activating protein [Myxococcales bacterium]|nr:glycyl-radical enzyme activating protein [Myxococcales bacterium]
MPPLGLVSDAQRFSVHDGPGIRTTVFLKGCPLRCAWCQNPESLRPDAELAFSAERCRDGAACQQANDCVAACPRGALAATAERVVRARCDGCGLCVRPCAFDALRVVGRSVAVDELVPELLRDRPFFASSGGGVTLSGGEPTYQLDFAAALARACRAAGVSVGLQTSGAFAWEPFRAELDAFDFVQFDLKVLDAERHRALCGADNRTLLDNARRLAAHHAAVTFRMPVVPGCTDDDDNLRAAAAFLRDLDVRHIQLLRYHRLGEAKLARVGHPLPPLHLASAAGAPPSGAAAASADARLVYATALLRAEGLEVTA